MSLRIAGPAAILLSVGLILPAAAADRLPTAEEKTKIEAALKAAGFTKWEEIEFEEGDREIEVDDAVGADGKAYDLELDPKTFAVTSKREEKPDAK